eukprot:g1043.t1
MTMFHMLNCAALAFGPFAIIYYRIVVPEALLGTVFKTAGVYGLTQVFTMLALASFVPPEEHTDPGAVGQQQQAFVFTHELARTIICASELVGMFIAARWSRGMARHLKVIGVGFGWAVSDAVLATGIPMVYSAASTEFDIGNTYAAAGCSIKLLKTLAAVALLDRMRSKQGAGTIGLLMLALIEAEHSLGVFLLAELGVARPVVLLVQLFIAFVAYKVAGVSLVAKD